MRPGNGFTEVIAVVGIGGLLWCAPLSSQAPSMPRLRPGFTTHNVDLSPLDRLSPIAIGPQGAVLFISTPTAKDLLLTLVDSTGKLLLRLGHKGEGPGEVVSPRAVEVTRDRLSVWDVGTGRFQSWDFRGTLIETLKPSQSLEVVSAVPEPVGMRHNGSGWRPVALTRPSGELRELLPAVDTFLAAHFDAVPGKPRPAFSPIFGLWDAGFVIADASSYTLALFRWDGVLIKTLKRDLPPAHASAGRADDFVATMRRQAAARGGTIDEARIAEMKKGMAAFVLPAITPGGPIRADARHRIWTLGMEGDSAFADLFTRDKYLGRLHLPCRLFNGFWSLSGSWLAVACLPDDPNADVDAVIKTFRIVEVKPS